MARIVKQIVHGDVRLEYCGAHPLDERRLRWIDQQIADFCARLQADLNLLKFTDEE